MKLNASERNALALLARAIRILYVDDEIHAAINSALVRSNTGELTDTQANFVNYFVTKLEEEA